MFFASVAVVLPLLSAAIAHPEGHAVKRALPKRWYQDDDHPVHALFKRGGTDGIQYAQVGSPTWQAAFPTTTPDTSKLPQAWVDALDAAVKAGKIPDIPPSTNPDKTNPVYPNGLTAMDPKVCSGYAKCRGPGDIWDAPDGYFATGFDDGPYEGSAMLYKYLTDNQIAATHFMIGVYIRNQPDMFLQAFNNPGADIAVHTYTHPFMTTLTNLQVVAELGWTMEIIHNSTGGRVPRYWRPPSGDADNRVRAIAMEVFNLRAIYWNQDTEDWSLTTGGTTPQAINASMTQWLHGPKHPGLIVLEHELSPASVQAFIDAVPVIKATGWNMQSAATLADGDVNNADANVYQNADSATSSVTPQLVGVPDGDNSASPNSSQSSSGSSSNSPSSSSTSSASTPNKSGSGAQANSPQNNNAATSLSTSMRWLTSAMVMAFVGVFA